MSVVVTDTTIGERSKWRNEFLSEGDIHVQSQHVTSVVSGSAVSGAARARRSRRLRASRGRRRSMPRADLATRSNHPFGRLHPTSYVRQTLSWVSKIAIGTASTLVVLGNAAGSRLLIRGVPAPMDRALFVGELGSRFSCRRLRSPAPGSLRR